MKLISISIKNYHSIHDEVVLPIAEIAKSACYMLLGINESGKSSILKAIALLNNGDTIDYENDCNKSAQNDGEDIEIAYSFEPASSEEYSDIFNTIGIEENLAKKIILKSIQRKIAVDADDERVDYYHIYLKTSKTFEFLLDKYVIVTRTVTKNVSGVEKKTKTKSIELKTAENEEKNESGEITNILTVSALESFLEEHLFHYLEDYLPEVIFWEPLEDKYLINKPINLTDFADDINSSIPLRNCFRIAGISSSVQISARIKSIKDKPGKTLELIQVLDESVTKHINEKWGEHNINVKFAINNMELSFLVEDKDDSLPKYVTTQRSDGFKHFVSILLNVSAENETKVLTNKIILLDEPETHLHPSGQRYLRDELLEIAKNNFVMFATHSIYMVDTKNINRHFSVKKTIGKTTCTQIEKDNPYREEVLYEALGTSVLELIEPNVLIFEGKTDRDIFEMFTRKFKAELKPPKITLISADGCSNIHKYTKFFNTKVVKGYVIADSDTEGRQQKETILKEDGYNDSNTFVINDVLNTKIEATLEDLFDKKFMIEAVSEHYGIAIDLDAKKPLISQVKQILHLNKKPYKDSDKEILRQLYFAKISKLTNTELRKEKYYQFAEALCLKIST